MNSRRSTSHHLRCPVWIKTAGPDQDVVLSTRCRIARNVAEFPFPWRCTTGQKKLVAEGLINAADRTGRLDDRAEAASSVSMDLEEYYSLLEYRSITREWFKEEPHQWFWPSYDRNLSILINEEDHLRIQMIEPGFQLARTYALGLDLANSIEEFIPFSKHPEFGYLTPSLSNVGNGMRLGCLLHLPCISQGNLLNKLIDSEAMQDCTLRGIYGEGTSGAGDFYQLSNRFCYGDQYSRTLASVRKGVIYAFEMERSIRKSMYGNLNGRDKLSEHASNCLTEIYSSDLPVDKLLGHLSWLRLAVCMGALPGEIYETTRWLSITGIGKSLTDPDDQVTQRYEAVRRTAMVRNELRRYVD